MKKLFTLFALLVAIVTGAQADETFSMASKWGSQPFTKIQNGVTVTFSETEKSSTQNGYIKFVKGQTLTISSTAGNITALSFTSDSEKYGNAKGTSVNTGTLTGVGTANISWSGDASEIIITNDASKGGDWRIASIVVTNSSAPATKPTITKQPQDATYVIGTEDYPSMSVTATASAGELKYQWHIIVPSVGDIAIPGAEASTLSLATYATQMAAYLSQEGSYSIYCNVADDNDNVDSNNATLTVTATAPATPNDPTFDKEDGASMIVGEEITITSSAGSTIYYRWSGSAGKTWTPEAFKDGRTGYDSPCTTTTSTKGDRYVYAMAENNGNYSNITSIHVVVSDCPVKGVLSKTSDEVEKNAEAPEIPTFTLVDANNNTVPASMGAEGSTKDVFVKYVVTGTEGIITLNSDATAIESISTATVGTATATITITQNKDGYPIISGEGTYEYTITVNDGSTPATKPTITKQPQDATFTVGDATYPSMSVTATASAGELKYEWFWKFSEAVDYVSTGFETQEIDLTGLINNVVEIEGYGDYYFKCTVTDDNGSVESNIATLTIAEAPAGLIDPTFDKEDGAAIKAGDAITITSSAGSTIYYRWSGSAGKTWTPEAFKDGRTGYDSPCTTTTSTKGDRYLYAMAESNGSYSNITSIHVVVSENPVKGQLDKIADVVEQYAEAPAVPVFSLVDADGNSSPASMGAEGSTKDIFVKYVVTGTEGIITLNSDATAIESISTATAGTATATITITQNKDAYPIIDGEGTYEYTITVNEGSIPTTGPVITTQPQDATYVIGTEDYPSMSVEAVTSGGELKYQWHITVPSVGDITIPGAEASTLSLATYATQMAAYLSQEGSYSIYCHVADDNGNVDSNTATLTVSEAAPGPELDEQTDVTGDMTWDWSKFGVTEIKFDATTTPKKVADSPASTEEDEFVLSNVVAYGFCEAISPDFGDAQALVAAGEYPVRDGSYYQGRMIKFNTTVPGTVKITCSSTGKKDNHNRDIIIAGQVAGNVTTTDMIDSDEVSVDAGEVIIKGVSHGVTPSDDTTDAQYLRISKIVFTTGTPTGVNGVAEAETEAPANVKIIKNGQLFIGKFNIAGQLVK